MMLKFINMKGNFVTLLVIILPVLIRSDTPANCTYEDIVGEWMFEVSGYGGDNTIDCSKPGPVTYNLKVHLMFPDVAVDATYGTKGFWTLIYNQGFEVVINNRKYFAFSEYTQEGTNVTMNCSETLPGWSHNVVGSDWACYVGRKTAGATKAQQYQQRREPDYSQMMYKNDQHMVAKINQAQKSWRATTYPEHERYTVEEMRRRAGAYNRLGGTRPHPAPSSVDVAKAAASLPESFDWRNVHGQDFVSPVRNQAQCGSCFSFAALAMLEARLRIATNNTVQKVFAPQDVVACSEYSQGCEGGFPYLIAGKYAEDFGVVEESCYPYQGTDTSCSDEKKGCRRYYATGYHYVGGFYGACNEELMRLALHENGPIAIGFEVYNDFMSYKGGVYQHTGVRNSLLKFDPFEITNHAVLVVGYGVDEASGLKYWSVKNSWGTTWGEDGYFRILRGADECGIESMAMESFPIFP